MTSPIDPGAGVPPAPPAAQQVQGNSGGDEAVATLIPYRNPNALIAYYLGIFSLLPVLGMLPAAPALICGILGLRARKRSAESHGLIHAWIGIVLGGLSLLGHGAIIAMMIVSMMANSY